MGSDRSDLTRADTLQGQQLPWRGSPHDTQGSAMCGGDHAVRATGLSQEGWAVRAGHPVNEHVALVMSS